MSDFGLEFSMTTWGSPDAPKRALLLHGLQGVGQVFFKVAKILVANGYRVDAPDLLGHGWAPRSSTFSPSPSSSSEGTKYTIPLIASHLGKHLSSTHYDVVAGVSFGSTALLPLLTSFDRPPARAVLVEPILDMTPIPAERVEAMIQGVKNAPTEEEVQAMNPTWSREECALRRMGVLQLDKRVVGDLFDEVNHEHLSHSLIPSSTRLPNTELIILAGDPALRSVYPASHASLLKQDYPHVKFGQRLGASHDMHKDKPEVVAGVIMGGLEGIEGVEVLA